MVKKIKLIPGKDRQPQHVQVSRRRRKAFLGHLARTGRVTESAQRAGYTDSSYLRRLRRQDEDFAAEWDLAEQAAGDVIEDEAIRRAVEGVEKPVFYKGEEVATVTEYSDGLLQTVLKGAKRDKYAEHRKVDHEVRGGIALLPMPAASAEDWERQAAEVHNGQKQLQDREDAEEKVVDAEFEEVGEAAEIARA